MDAFEKVWAINSDMSVYVSPDCQGVDPADIKRFTSRTFIATSSITTSSINFSTITTSITTSYITTSTTSSIITFFIIASSITSSVITISYITTSIITSSLRMTKRVRGCAKQTVDTLDRVISAMPDMSGVVTIINR